MNTNLQVFQFENSSIRTVELEGVIWFVASEVSDILGYSRTADSLRLVDTDDKLLITNKNADSALSVFEIPDRGLYLINESGMYSMVLNSRREDSKRFKKWVTSEVLPSIRRTGQYQVPQFGSPEDLMVGQAKLMLQVCESLSVITKRVTSLEDRVNEALPKNGYLTIKGFCSKYKIQLTIKDRQAFGLEAANLCKKRNLFIDRVPDHNYGTVGAYPEEILLELCEVE